MHININEVVEATTELDKDEESSLNSPNKVALICHPTINISCTTDCTVDICFDCDYTRGHNLPTVEMMNDKDVPTETTDSRLMESEEPKADLESVLMLHDDLPTVVCEVEMKDETHDIFLNELASESNTKQESIASSSIIARKSTQIEENETELEKDVEPAFDISPYVKSARYGQTNQKFKVFWLPNSELSSLMKVPSIAEMINSHKYLKELIYIVFTPGGLDVLQDVSHVKGIELRPLHTPFVILYSYSFRSMYFKVISKSVDAINTVTFSGDGEDTIAWDCSKPDERKRKCTQQQNTENQPYEFYRSYLYGIDDGQASKRISVSFRGVREPVLDMREVSVEGEQYGRTKSSLSRTQNVEYSPRSSADSNCQDRLQESADVKNSINMPGSSNDLVEFDGGVTMKLDAKPEDVIKPAPKSSLWVYERADEHEESDDETVYGLPKILLTEVKRMLGPEHQPKLLQCNRSMVNLRTEAMIKRNFTLYERDDTCITNDVKNNLKVLKDEPPDSKAMYQVGERVLNAGDVIVVKMPTIYRGHPEEDIIKIYHKDTISLCFQTLESLDPDGPKDCKITLIQYCPNIFWNLILMGDLEESLHQMAPSVFSNKRQRRRMSRASIPENTPKPTAVLSKPNNIPVFDNNFLIMQNLFEGDAQHKIRRLEKIRKKLNEGHGKITRKGVSKYLDKEDLISAVMDSEGLLLRSMQSLTPNQKIVVYQACLRRGYYAPIRLEYIAEKGRAVFAAYDIGKDEYIVEYKGQLITEKLAKHRDRKYDRSRSYKGSFVFYFKINNKRYCIDATEEEILYGPGRLINHSRKNPNIVPKALEIDDCPRLFFVAKRDIKSGEELLIDYGERDPSVIKDNPWLLD